MKETKYQEQLRKKYGNKKLSQYEQDLYDWLYDAPIYYKNDNEMQEYFSEHPDATLTELDDYWGSITPPGLAPDDDGADLLGDNE